MVETKRIVALISLFFLYACSCSFSVNTYDFDHVEYVRNYDGDTIYVNIPTLPPIFGKNIPIRVYGVDTPEIKGRCVKEKQLAWVARSYVHNLLSHAKHISLRDMQRGKYFRIVARVIVDGKDLSKLLLQKKLATPYFGGTKHNPWCGGRK